METLKAGNFLTCWGKKRINTCIFIISLYKLCSGGIYFRLNALYQRLRMLSLVKGLLDLTWFLVIPSVFVFFFFHPCHLEVFLKTSKLKNAKSQLSKELKDASVMPRQIALVTCMSFFFHQSLGLIVSIVFKRWKCTSE